MTPQAEVFINPQWWCERHARPLGDENLAYLSITKTGSSRIRDSIGELYMKDQFTEHYDRMFTVIRDPYQRLVSSMKTCHSRLMKRVNPIPNWDPASFDLDHWLDRFDHRDFRWVYDEHMARQSDFIPQGRTIDFISFAQSCTQVPEWFRKHGFIEIADRYEQVYDPGRVTVYPVDQRVVNIVETYYARDLDLYEAASE